MTRSLGIRLLVTAVVAVSGIALLTAAGGSSRADTISTTMKDAGDLDVGNDVRSAGVIIGSIKSIDLVNGAAHVVLQVDPSVLPIHQDATLEVRPVNLLGENYVDLNIGSASSPFMSNAVIPTAHTSDAVTLQDVLNTFQAPTAASLASVVTTLGEGLQGNGGQLATALKKLVPAMTEAKGLGDLLSQQNGVLKDLVGTLSPVANVLATNNGKMLTQLVTSTRDTLTALTAQEGALRQTILDLPGTLDSAQKTLARFGATAQAATPTLHSLRPLTDNLTQVTGELQNFAAAADPALASLNPVLDEANKLLNAAAPILAQLRQVGPDLQNAAHALNPVSRSLLDVHLQDVMDFVRKWALSTNGQDGISHYFRGVVYVTPSTLKALAASLLPSGLNLGTLTSGKTSPLSGLKLPQLTTLTNNLMKGLGLSANSSSTNPLNALGLTSNQEHSLLGQLLGGGN